MVASRCKAIISTSAGATQDNPAFVIINMGAGDGFELRMKLAWELRSGPIIVARNNEAKEGEAALALPLGLPLDGLCNSAV